MDKIHKVLGWATKDLTGVSVSDVEMAAELSLYDGITTREIHEVLVKAAYDLISPETPNYSFVAGRLLNYQLRKDVWGEADPPRLLEHIKECVLDGVYDKEFLEWYSESEILKLNKLLKHDRDYIFTHAGLQKMMDNYLVKDKSSGTIYETPQFAYLMIAATLLKNEKRENRLALIREAYDALSKHKISLATPILVGVRTPRRYYASCILISVADDMHSIMNSNSVVGLMTSGRAGIGLEVGSIRPLTAPVRGGETLSTGLIPFLKMFESTVKGTNQGSRGGSATCFVPAWHYEIENIIVLKNNKGTDDNRVRKLDYAIQWPDLFMQRIIENGNITLFCPHESSELYERFGEGEEWAKLYEKCEKKKGLKFKKVVKARELVGLFLKERLETGRIYAHFVDTPTSWRDKVRQSNLCVEVLQPTKPIYALDDPNGEIGVCILGAMNILTAKLEEYPILCKILVRLLDSVIDHQDYLIKACENFATKKRSLAVGIMNGAAYLAKNKTKYTDKEAPELLSVVAENLSFYLLKASCELAEERGRCIDFSSSRYSDGWVPADTASRKTLDWDSLKSGIAQHGLRNCTLTAVMPGESSSVVHSSTNSLEPVRSLLSYKKGRTRPLKVLVPNIKDKGHYQLAFDVNDNKAINAVYAAVNEYVDMGMSLNHYYDYKKFENGTIPFSALLTDMIDAWKKGLRTMYYAVSNDGSDDASQEETCAGGSCAI